LARWAGVRARGDVNRLAALVALPLGPLRRLASWQWQGARACNLGLWRSDLDRIDGFDAHYAGGGREDSDLFVRLLPAGVCRKDGRFATGVVHLWHPAADRAELASNDARLDALIRGDRVQAESGLSALRGAGADEASMAGHAGAQS